MWAVWGSKGDYGLAMRHRYLGIYLHRTFSALSLSWHATSKLMKHIYLVTGIINVGNRSGIGVIREKTLSVN